MESIVECLCESCGADFNTKLSHRRMTGTISVIFGLLSVLTDLFVAVGLLLKMHYYWGSLILSTIVFTNLHSMYKYTSQISPSCTTAIMSFFGLLNTRILSRYWSQLDQEAHYKTLMDARLVEVLLQSIPSAMVQIYSVILTDATTFGGIFTEASAFISALNFGYGLRTWYKFTIVNGDSIDFEAENQFVSWYVWLEIFVINDLLFRTASLALFLAIIGEDFEYLRPLPIFIVWIAVFLIGFTLDIMDNNVARQTCDVKQLLLRALSVGLSTLGTGFMFILFAQSKNLARIELIFRYLLSIGFYVFFHLNATTDTFIVKRDFWMITMPIVFVIATVSALYVLVKQSGVKNEIDSKRKSAAMVFRGSSKQTASLGQGLLEDV